MKYQEFENSLNSLFTDAKESVDIDLLIENIHKAPQKRRLGGWLSAGLFALLSIVSLIGLNHVIKSNHYEIIPDENMMLTKKNPEIKDITMIETNDNNDTSNENIPESYVSGTDNEGTSNSIIALNKNSGLRKKKQLSNKNKTKSTLSTIDINNEKNTNNSINSKVGEVNFRSTLEMLTPMTSKSKYNFIDIRKRPLLIKDQVDCPTFGKKTKWHLEIIPEIGYIVPIKTLTSNSSEPTEVYQMRKDEESSLEGLQAALYLRLRPNNAPVYIKGGVSYTRLTEQMNLNTTYTVSDTTIGIISITESQNGDTLTVIRGEIITDSTFTRMSKDHYSLQLIDFPVAIGVNKSLGGGWRVGGEVGAQFNISLKSDGKLLEGTGRNSYTDLPASGRYSSNVGISFFGGITLEKAISSTSAFYISPRFRYFPKAFSSESYNIKQEYQFVGLHAGYIYSF